MRDAKACQLLAEVKELLTDYFDHTYDGACWERDAKELLKKLEAHDAPDQTPRGIV